MSGMSSSRVMGEDPAHDARSVRSRTHLVDSDIGAGEQTRSSSETHKSTRRPQGSDPPSSESLNELKHPFQFIENGVLRFSEVKSCPAAADRTSEVIQPSRDGETANRLQFGGLVFDLKRPAGWLRYRRRRLRAATGT